MAESNDRTIKELVKILGVGGGVNTLQQASIIGYNPDIELQWTNSTPYQLIIHERFRGKHLITKIDLDDYKGAATRIHPQKISTEP